MDPSMPVWVAYCPSLGLTVQADTYPELLGAAGEAVAEMAAGLIVAARPTKVLRRLASPRSKSSKSDRHVGTLSAWALPMKTVRVAARDLLTCRLVGAP